jgi:hypothetical protein
LGRLILSTKQTAAEYQCNQSFHKHCFTFYCFCVPLLSPSSSLRHSFSFFSLILLHFFLCLTLFQIRSSATLSHDNFQILFIWVLPTTSKCHDITTSFDLFQRCLFPVHQIPHTTRSSSTLKQPSYFGILGKISHLGQ